MQQAILSLPTKASSQSQSQNGRKTTSLFPIKRNIRAVLYHLDGSTSEMNFTMPVYSAWSDPCEIAASAIRDYVFALTKYWIKISHFEVYIESVMSNGKTACCMVPFKHEIPVGKIFDEQSGKWLTVEKTLKIHNKKMGIPSGCSYRKAS